MHSLLGAVLSVGRELELKQALYGIVEAATALVDARYGALGVIGADGRGCPPSAPSVSRTSRSPASATVTDGKEVRLTVTEDGVGSPPAPPVRSGHRLSLAPVSRSAARPASSRATGTRNGEQET